MKSVNLPAVAVNSAKSAKSAFPWDVVGSGVSSALSFVMQLANNKRMQENFEEQMQFNKEQADINRIFNSIPSLVNQYKAAGLNPNLITSASGSSSMAESPSAPNFDSGHVPNPLNGFSQAAYSLSQMENQDRLTDANVRLMDSEAFRNEQDALEMSRRDDNYYASIIQRNKATINELNEHANYFSKLSTTEENKHVLQNIEKDWLPKMYQAQIDSYTSASARDNSIARLNRQQWDIIHETSDYIIKGAKWDYEEQTFVFNSADGNQTKVSMSPKSLQFWRNYYDVQQGYTSAKYLNRYGDAQAIIGLIGQTANATEQFTKAYANVATGGASAVASSASDAGKNTVKEVISRRYDSNGNLLGQTKTFSRNRPPLN